MSGGFGPSDQRRGLGRIFRGLGSRFIFVAVIAVVRILLTMLALFRGRVPFFVSAPLVDVGAVVVILAYLRSMGDMAKLGVIIRIEPTWMVRGWFDGVEVDEVLSGGLLGRGRVGRRGIIDKVAGPLLRPGGRSRGWRTDRWSRVGSHGRGGLGRAHGGRCIAGRKSGRSLA